MDLNEYKVEIQNIKKYALSNNISPEQVNQIFKECFCLLDAKVSSRINTVFRLLKLLGIFFFVIISSVLILYNHPQTHNIFLRNLQNFIYPGLRIFRKLAVPVISKYPSLTEWYDEWCIIENPYFQVNEMDCWPCSNVDSVKNLTGYKTASLNSGIPFTRLEKYENFNVDELFKLYCKSQEMIHSQMDAVPVDTMLHRNEFDLTNQTFDENAIFKKKAHVTWRVNRMEVGRKLRKFFPKLPGVPDSWSPSTEKFVFIDKPEAAEYNLPNPECANVIIQCVSGERMIQLRPSPECTRNCEKLNILLSASQSLWYNWWYWRPISIPSNNTTDITINYLTSFC